MIKFLVLRHKREKQCDPRLAWEMFHRIYHMCPSGYMGRYGWLKAMTQLSKICGASPVNNKILLFGGQDSHFDGRDLTQMQSKTSSPSYLKQVTPSTTSPITMGLTQNWRLYTIFRRLSGWLSMLPRAFNLTTWTLSWLKHGKPSRYHLVTS